MKKYEGSGMEMKKRRKGWETRMCRTTTLQLGKKPPYMHDHWRYCFENRSGNKWDLKRPVMHPTSRELLEEQIPKTARALKNAALRNDHKHHKTLSPIYVICHKHSAISVVWLKSSLGKYILDSIKLPCRQYSFSRCILPLTSHNVLCQDDRENTVHKALQWASMKKTHTPRNSITVISDFKATRTSAWFTYI